MAGARGELRLSRSGLGLWLAMPRVRLPSRWTQPPAALACAHPPGAVGPGQRAGDPSPATHHEAVVIHVQDQVLAHDRQSDQRDVSPGRKNQTRVSARQARFSALSPARAPGMPPGQGPRPEATAAPVQLLGGHGEALTGPWRRRGGGQSKSEERRRAGFGRRRRVPLASRAAAASARTARRQPIRSRGGTVPLRHWLSPAPVRPPEAERARPLSAGPDQWRAEHIDGPGRWWVRGRGAGRLRGSCSGPGLRSRPGR